MIWHLDPVWSAPGPRVVWPLRPVWSGPWTLRDLAPGYFSDIISLTYVSATLATLLVLRPSKYIPVSRLLHLLFFYLENLPGKYSFRYLLRCQLQQDAIPANLSKTALLSFSLSIPLSSSLSLQHESLSEII